MFNPEVKISEIGAGEREQVVDALVGPWEGFTEPQRDNGEPFRREDIAVHKTKVESLQYPIYVCIPRDIWTDNSIKVHPGERLTDVTVGYKDVQVSPYTHTYISVLIDRGIPLTMKKSGEPHGYTFDNSLFVALPDKFTIPSLFQPDEVREFLKEQDVTAMILMCGFARGFHVPGTEARIAIFTKPIVK